MNGESHDSQITLDPRTAFARARRRYRTKVAARRMTSGVAVVALVVGAVTAVSRTTESDRQHWSAVGPTQALRAEVPDWKMASEPMPPLPWPKPVTPSTLRPGAWGSDHDVMTPLARSAGADWTTFELSVDFPDAISNTEYVQAMTVLRSRVGLLGREWISWQSITPLIIMKVQGTRFSLREARELVTTEQFIGYDRRVRVARNVNAARIFEEREVREVRIGVNATRKCSDSRDGSNWYASVGRDLCYSLGPSLIDGNDVVRADAAEQGGQWGVNVTFSPGSLRRITTGHKGRKIAIVINGEVAGTLAIADRVVGDSVRITGDFTETQARDIVQALSLAVPIPRGVRVLGQFSLLTVVSPSTAECFLSSEPEEQFACLGMNDLVNGQRYFLGTHSRADAAQIDCVAVALGEMTLDRARRVSASGIGQAVYTPCGIPGF